MAELPVVAPRQAIRALERAGFKVRRQKGAHAILGKEGHPYLVTVPVHRKDLAPGTLRAIIRDAGLTVEEFVSQL